MSACHQVQTRDVDVDNDGHGRSHCVLVCVSSHHRMLARVCTYERRLARCACGNDLAVICVCNPTCNDQIVLAHARALLTSTPEGATAYVQP